MVLVTLRLGDDTAAGLERLAARLERTSVDVATQAIESYIQFSEGQVAEIEAGIAEADQGDFANASEIASVLARYIKTTPTA
ncbi:MAG: hypothetical protein JNM13_14460 [Hyphomicrobiaceae bacterium]|nr:hypothetical protein [Hyphomicrobiaceae bacterium]